MAQDRDDMIRSYVSRVMEVRERREGAMRAEDLRAIARDIGLSEEDLAAAEQEALDHIARGRQFLQHGRSDDAIAALSKAVALAPDQLDARIDLAQALRDRFRRTGRSEDRANAIAQARACIDQDPSCQRAYLLLNELDQPAVGARAGSSGSGVGALVAFAALGAFILLGGVAAVGFLTLAPSSSPPMPPEVSTYDAPQPVTPNLPAPTAAQPAAAPELPLEVKLPDNTGLTATVVSSKYDYYKHSDTGYYKGVIELKNDLGNKAFTDVTGTLKLFGSDGAVILSDSSSALSRIGSDHALPGDTMSVAWTKEVKVTPARAVFEISAVNTTLANPPASPPTQLSWDIDTPFKERLTMATRRFMFKRYHDNPKGYASLTLELRVTGDTPIEKGRMRVELLDAQGKLITHKPLYLPGMLGGPIRPDTVRLVSGTWESTVDVDSVRVAIEEIE